MCPFTRWRHVFASTVVAAMTWSVGSSLTIFPHSLSYFNELTSVLSTPGDMSYPKPLRESDHKHNEFSAIRRGICAGPRNGPRHLLDSNIDWGQDLFFLKKLARQAFPREGSTGSLLITRIRPRWQEFQKRPDRQLGSRRNCTPLEEPVPTSP